MVNVFCQMFPGVRISGIEIDPVMIDIGRRYFDLDKIPNLKIINADANSWLPTTSPYFDYILVDLYLGDKVPDFVHTKKFLNKIRKFSKVAVFNHLVYDDTKRRSAEKLIKLLSPRFKNIRLQRILTNVLIICE